MAARFHLVIGDGGELVGVVNPDGSPIDPKPDGTQIERYEGVTSINLIHAEETGQSHCCWVVIYRRLYCIPC